MKILQKIKAFQHNTILKASLTLVSGLAGAQAIVLAAMPVLTRLYSPQDFSALAVFIGVVAIVSSAACLRLDIAIPIPEDENVAANLLLLSVVFAVCTAAVSGVVLFSIPSQTLGLGAIATALLPVAIFFAGTYSALQFYLIRRSEFRFIATNRIAQATAGVSTQLGWGLLVGSPFGLILGQTINSGLGSIRIAASIVERGLLRSTSLAGAKAALVEFSRFPKYSTWDALANSGSIHLPVILIAWLGIGSDAGYLMLAMYAMQAPLGLIGNSIAQAYMSEAPKASRDRTLDRLTSGIWGGLVKIGVGPLILAGFIAPFVFPFIFGQEWQRAGELISWMVPWFVLQLIAVPTSNALHVQGHMRTALALQLFGLVSRVAFVLVAWALWRGYVAEAFAVSGALFYFVYCLFIARAVGIGCSTCKEMARSSAPIVCAWSILGVAAATVASWFL